MTTNLNSLANVSTVTGSGLTDLFLDRGRLHGRLLSLGEGEPAQGEEEDERCRQAYITANQQAQQGNALEKGGREAPHQFGPGAN